MATGDQRPSWSPGPLTDLNSVIQAIYRMPQFWEQVAEFESELSLPLTAQSLTISSGVVTASGSRFVTVDTESAAATDDLDTIGGTAQGDIVIVQSTSSARVVTLTESGNLILGTFGSFTLLDPKDKAFFINVDGTNLHAISLRNNT